MPTGQNYATNVPQTQLTSSINATATSMSVTSATGWPAPPFTAVIDLGSASQEPVDVTAVVGTSFTITRSIDGTSAFAHTNGATVTHADIGRDFREPRSHIDAATSPDNTGHDIHGIGSGSSVVGTATTQTLTNKTIGGGIFTGGQSMGSGTWTGNGDVLENTYRVNGIGGLSQPWRLADSHGTGPPTSGTYQTGDIVYDNQLFVFWTCTAAGTPGTWQLMSGEVFLGTHSASTSPDTFTFPVPALFNRIRVEWVARGAAAVANSALTLQLNGDTTNNYLYQRVETNNATVTGTNSGGATNVIQVGTIPAASATTNYLGRGEFTLDGITSAGFAVVTGMGSAFTSTTNSFVGTYSGQYLSTSAITSLSLSVASGFVSGTMFSYYGLN